MRLNKFRKEKYMMKTPETGIIRYSRPAGHWVAGRVEFIVAETRRQPNTQRTRPNPKVAASFNFSMQNWTFLGNFLTNISIAMWRCFSTPIAIEMKAIQIIRKRATSSDHLMLVPKNLRLKTCALTMTTMTRSTSFEYSSRSLYTLSNTNVTRLTAFSRGFMPSLKILFDILIFPYQIKLDKKGSH